MIGAPLVFYTGFLIAGPMLLTDYAVNMFGWIALTHYVFFVETPELKTAAFWFMMQIEMIVGFCTSYPADWYLVKKSIKCHVSHCITVSILLIN
ncbi:DUF4396 domain-containing protein [Lederbergia sp. NSJ-179]|uniref:DUF4396 domain-containing protein n=1 Tax=Lederbergia sp. NSJ-179 TaxID=2931402 RepID=UPI001FD21EDA|nr:DUF4396 domain-containing protein [Lederbergia sp. NSJ-179]